MSEDIKTLPPLPEPFAGCAGVWPEYTADQMREYAERAVLSASASDKKDAELYRHFKKCFDTPTHRIALARAFGGRDFEFEPSFDDAIAESIAANAGKTKEGGS